MIPEEVSKFSPPEKYSMDSLFDFSPQMVADLLVFFGDSPLGQPKHTLKELFLFRQDFVYVEGTPLFFP